MTNKKSHRVPQELKQQILERIKIGDKPISQIAEEHGVSSNTVYTWLSKNTEGSPSQMEYMRLQKENRQLFELVGKLTVQLSVAQKKIY